MSDENEDIEFDEEADPSVPTDLLEIHLELDANNVTAEDFRTAYGVPEKESK